MFFLKNTCHKTAISDMSYKNNLSESQCFFVSKVTKAI